MNPIRDRVKEHFPTVLLTLLSIVQALALELLWSHLHEVDYLFEATWGATIAWTQIVATFLGIVLVWVVYASNVMRFRWVPTTSDSVFPFLIGLLELMLIETLGPDEVGAWLLILALVYGLMNWVAHATMRRARQDSDNQAFFALRGPAELRDFYHEIAIVCALVLAGIYLFANRENQMLAMILLLATNGALGRQFYLAARFWESSVATEHASG